MAFRGRGFTSGGEKSVSGFSAAACKIQASKYYIKSLPLVLKDKKKLLLSRWKVRCTAASWLCVCPPEVECLVDIWKPSICIMHISSYIGLYLKFIVLCYIRADSHTISSLEWETKEFPEVNHPRLTCEVQTLLKVTNMKVCTKQQKVMSLYSHSDATVSSRSWGRKAIMPMGKESQVSWMRYSM